MLEAATRLVARHGMDGFKLADVGIEAGYSKGLPAHYYGTKDVFEAAFLNYLSQEYDRELRQPNTESGLKALMSLVRSFCDPEKSQVCICVVALMQSPAPPSSVAAAEAVRRMRQITNTVIQARIGEGQAGGQIRQDIDSAQLCLVITAAIGGILATWLTDTTTDIVAAGAALEKLLVLGLSEQ